MPEWLQNFFSLTREISSKVALPVCVTCLVVIFAPAYLPDVTGLKEFKQATSPWIGGILVISASALVTNFLWKISEIIKPVLQEKILIHRSKSGLNNITEEEKLILRKYIFDGEAYVSMPVSNGTINLLERKMVVSRASELSSHYTNFHYILQPWAREYLEKNLNLIE